MATVNWLNRVTRNGGVYISSVVTIPADGSMVEAVIGDCDWGTVSNTVAITWRLEVSADSGATWQVAAAGGSVAGTPNPKGNPRLSVGLIPYRGMRVRLYVEFAGSLRFSVGGQVI